MQLAISKARGSYESSLDFGRTYSIFVSEPLTVTNLLRNELDAESAKMLAEVAKQKGISLCGIQRDQTTADFSNQHLKPPDAILLASDLLQARVTGSLTSINLSENNLTWRASHGRDMAGITELAAALGVNGSLTKRVNGSLTKMRYVSPRAN